MSERGMFISQALICGDCALLVRERLTNEPEVEARTTAEISLASPIARPGSGPPLSAVAGYIRAYEGGGSEGWSLAHALGGIAFCHEVKLVVWQENGWPVLVRVRAGGDYNTEVLVVEREEAL